MGRLLIEDARDSYPTESFGYRQPPDAPRPDERLERARDYLLVPSVSGRLAERLFAGRRDVLNVGVAREDPRYADNLPMLFLQIPFVTADSHRYRAGALHKAAEAEKLAADKRFDVHRPELRRTSYDSLSDPIKLLPLDAARQAELDAELAAIETASAEKIAQPAAWEFVDVTWQAGGRTPWRDAGAGVSVAGEVLRVVAFLAIGDVDEPRLRQVILPSLDTVHEGARLVVMDSEPTSEVARMLNQAGVQCFRLGKGFNAFAGQPSGRIAVEEL